MDTDSENSHSPLLQKDVLRMGCSAAMPAAKRSTYDNGGTMCMPLECLIFYFLTLVIDRSKGAQTRYSAGTRSKLTSGGSAGNPESRVHLKSKEVVVTSTTVQTELISGAGPEVAQLMVSV